MNNGSMDDVWYSPGYDYFMVRIFHQSFEIVPVTAAIPRVDVSGCLWHGSLEAALELKADRERGVSKGADCDSR